MCPPTRTRRSSCGAAPGSSPIRRSTSWRGSTGGGNAGAASWWRPPTITVAELDGQFAGFVTVDARTFDLDQIVVAPEAWGSGIAPALIAEAKRLSPQGLDLHVNKDNARAIRFYEKQGFTITGEAINWRSGAPVHKMSWRP